jgi:hypothetical protein
LIDKVSTLTESYIKQKECLILLTLDTQGLHLSNDSNSRLADIATQPAAALARKCDPKGERTIGIPVTPFVVNIH